jgi:hypothetical protein
MEGSDRYVFKLLSQNTLGGTEKNDGIVGLWTNTRTRNLPETKHEWLDSTVRYEDMTVISRRRLTDKLPQFASSYSSHCSSKNPALDDYNYARNCTSTPPTRPHGAAPS